LKTLRQLLLDADLEVQIMHHVDFVGFFVTLIYKLAPKRNGDVSISAIRFYDTLLFPLNRILDRLFGRYCGKNLFAVAHKSSK